MARDEAIFEAGGSGGQPATLRLYGWAPPAVSLGYFQALSGSVNLTALRRRGFGLVRRPTGGRAIAHHHEVTYSVCIRTEELGVGDGVLRSYKELSRGLEAGLRLLGLPAAMPDRPRHTDDSPGERAVPEAARADLHAVCFARTTAGDMAVAGRKIVGSAQLRRAGTILQHGSIPLRMDLAEHAEILCSSADTGTRAQLRSAAVGVAEALGREVGFEELAAAVVAGFTAALGVSFDMARLSDAESTRAAELACTRYATDAWNSEPGRRGGG